MAGAAGRLVRRRGANRLVDCASCSPSRFGFAEAALYRWSALTAIDRAFENAAQVVTPYAALGLNKFVAENGQA